MFAALALQASLFGVIELSDADLSKSPWLAVSHVLMVTWPISLIASLIGFYALLHSWWMRRTAPLRMVDQGGHGDPLTGGHLERRRPRTRGHG
ncbi:hypothetical protein [Actinomadura formosensis]|uniref:hypothetical protein n=1 Tax=Actinomadura formosensis TaxID=60706 RepID=UPI000B32ED64|nr:hypothetical protein [Actinomadura formosensis]